MADLESDYDPFAHRQVKKPNSDVRTAANLIKASLGSGILAIPLAISNVGWAVGIVGTFVVGAICTHCIQMLVTTSRGCCVMERKPLLGYADTCKATFSNGPKAIRKYAFTASVVAEVSLLCTEIGICCVYTVLVADSVKQVVDKFTGQVLAVEYYCLILIIPLLVLTQIKYLKWLAILSTIANVLLCITFSICLYYIFNEPMSFDDVKVVNDLGRMPAFLSTVIFAMEGITVVMPVENDMKTPRHFLGCPGVLSIAMGFIVILYATLGLLGYLRFGDALRGSITLNLPVDDWPAICAKLCIAVATLFTFPLQYYVIMDIYKNRTKAKFDYKALKMAVRIAGVFVIVGLSMALPMLEQVINIVGSVFYSILGLMIPCIIDTIFKWDNLGKYHWVFWKNLIIVIFGIFCLFSGCILAITDIINITKNKTA